ncbi:MAG: hypothetical protein P4L22_05635 [Candidatus Babeliales bacterium]|nr:hypothetical protein [Candidatus Babeliales bacterium]
MFIDLAKQSLKNAYNSDHQPKSILDCLLVGSINFVMLALGLSIIYIFSLIFGFQFSVSPFMKCMLFFGYLRSFAWYIIWIIKSNN